MQHRHSPAGLSDGELVKRIDCLALGERQSTASLVAFLAELDTRRLYLALGYTSLFAYCTERLHLSEHEALNRIEAARAGAVFPLVLDRLAEGAVNLTAIRLLRPLLTVENHVELLDRARHLGKEKILELIACLRPQPPVPSTVRRLPVPRTTSDRAQTVEEPQDSVPRLDLEAAATPLPAARLGRPVVAPLSETHYKVQVTFSRAAHDKLRRAQALMRHQVPNGDIGVVLERGLDALLVELMKKKVAVVERPRPARPQSESSRHIPAAVKRAVWTRDGGECVFKGTEGRRCGETACLEYHHVVPYAAGGQATVENIELRCRGHNGYEAELFFGPGKISGVRETAPAYG